MKKLLGMLCLLASVLPAGAVPVITGAISYSGTTTALSATGYVWSTGVLFAPTSASLLFNAPFTVSFGVKSTVVGTGGNQVWLDTRNVNGAIPGVIIGSLTSGSFVATRPLTAYGTSNGVMNPVSCEGPAQNCAPASTINNGQWHNVCWNVSASGSDLLVDGAVVDRNTQPIAYSMAQAIWHVGPGVTYSGAFRDIRVYSPGIGNIGCKQLARMAEKNLTPSSGTLQSNLVVHWPMNNCNGTGCADTSGGGNDLTYDVAGPVCTISAPANGFTNVAGNQTFSASCADPVGIGRVYFFVDGMNIGAFPFSVSTPPYQQTWDTTKFIDGAHTLTVQAVNSAGFYGAVSAPITGTTLNGVAAKTFYVNSSTGNDSNSCLTTLAPCATIVPGLQTKVNANNLHGGDSVLLAAGTSYTIANMNTANVLTLAGPSSGSGDFPIVTQNTYGGQTITFGTYGGTGQCTVLAGVTTDCATINLASYTGKRNNGVLQFINVPNVIIQNLRVINTDAAFGNTTACPATGTSACNSGIRYVAVNSFVSNGPAATLGSTTIQNNEVVNFYTDMYVSGLIDEGFGIGGNPCGWLVQNNYLHGTTVNTAGNAGVFSQVFNCQQGVVANPVKSGAYVSNVSTNIGGVPTLGGASGSGFVVTEGVSNMDMKFNAGSALCSQCQAGGNGYPYWTFVANNVTIFGNEGYNNFPQPAKVGIPDIGGIDMDHATGNSVAEFNYIHEVNGPAAGGFSNDEAPFLMQKDTFAYNILENANSRDNQAQGGMFNMVGGHGGHSLFNNTVWNGYNGQHNPVNSGIVVQSAGFSFGIACANNDQGLNIFANNIIVADAVNGSAKAYLAIGGGNSVSRNCNTVTYRANDWFQLKGVVTWQSILTTSNFSTLATWNAASGDTGIQTNPSFANGGGGLATTCYPGIGVVPVQPGTMPCPTNYELPHASALIGAGVDLTAAPYSLTLPTKDFFNGTIPNGGAGTGYNIGNDGANR